MPARGPGQPEEVRPLAHPDDDADSGRESHDHGIRNEAQDSAESGDAQEDEDHSRHGRGQQQAIDAELCGDPRQDDDEGAGGARDLDTAASEQRYDQAGNDSGIDARRGFDTA